MHKDCKILITGARGVLGTAIQELLQKNNITFLTPSRNGLDLLDKQAVHEYISKHKPEIVIHLAAMVFGLGGNLKKQMSLAVCNTTINNNLFAALYDNPPQKIFFAGTVASYAFPFKSLPLQEKEFFEGLPHYSEFGYAMAKRHAYTYLKILQQEKNTSFIYGILTNLFGKNDNFDVENGHVIPSLISKAFNAKRENTALEVWGDGSAERDFLYAEDAARAVCFLLDQKEPINDVINIASGKTHSIKYIAETIARAAKLEKGINFLSSMPTGITYRSIDIQNITKMSFKFSKTLEEALTDTYHWYASNKEAL